MEIPVLIPSLKSTSFQVDKTFLKVGVVGVLCYLTAIKTPHDRESRPCSLNKFYSSLSRLKSEFSVFSPTLDMVGYNEMKQDLVSLVCDELKINKPVSLIGHSMGGRTVMWTALNHPELIEKLLVVDVSPINVFNEVVIPLM